MVMLVLVCVLVECTSLFVQYGSYLLNSHEGLLLLLCNNAASYSMISTDQFANLILDCPHFLLCAQVKVDRSLDFSKCSNPIR